MHALLVLIASVFIAAAPHPADSARGLPRSTPEEQGISSAAILSFIEAAEEEIDALHSFMLVRNGHVVAEGWWGPYDAETPHVFFSLSKSFTSTAVGLAIEEGRFSIDDPVVSFFPEDAPAEPSDNLRAMRVRDLLRMNTGHQTEPGFWQNEPGSEARTWTQLFLEHPVPFKPGTHFLYNTPATYMLSAIVQTTTGMTLLDYLGPRLFEPLGFENPTWDESPEGISAGGFGLRARTEDIARFGQLYLQKGMWNGQQLVPAAWVEEATARQTSNGSSPDSDWDQGYGYQFWRSRHNAYRGDGAFGQYCLVIPEHNAVVAITAGVPDMQAVLNLIWEKLLPAFQAEPLPEDAGALDALETKLGGLTMRLPSGKPTAPLAAQVSGKWYAFPENDRGIEAVALDFGSESPALVVRTSEGETRTPVGMGSWANGRVARRSPFEGGFRGMLIHSIDALPEVHSRIRYKTHTPACASPDRRVPPVPVAELADGGDHRPVLYVKGGGIWNRIATHPKNKLSLRGAPFGCARGGLRERVTLIKKGCHCEPPQGARQSPGPQHERGDCFVANAPRNDSAG